MHSAIYHGTLRHRRFIPKAHEFTYSSTLFYIDLDELPELFAKVRFWSLNKPNLGAFQRKDYLGYTHNTLQETLPLKDAVRAEVTRIMGYCPMGPIRMLTNLRIFGFCFNPVTLYYVFTGDADKPSLILAQVNNTPWNERHSYVVMCDEETGKAKHVFDKAFHVSPFNPLDMQYHWVSTNPAEHLLVHMENHKQDAASTVMQCHMDATLTLTRHPWTAKALQHILWRQPWLAIKVPIAIYWQALKLIVKGIPFYPHKKTDKTDHSLAAIRLKATGEKP